jgi:hypothetical protein
VNIAAMQVFDKLRLQCLRIGKVDDADGNGLRVGKLRGAVASRAFSLLLCSAEA